MIWEIIVDAIKDTARIVPSLIIAFYLIDLVQSRFTPALKLKLCKFSRWGPVYGALIGSFPHGISIIATSLFIERIITPGTLIAVYIATSDEAIPILISNPKAYSLVLPLISIKIGLGIVTGFITDLFWKREIKVDIQCATLDTENNQKYLENIYKPSLESLIHALKHTIRVIIFIFMATAVLNFIFAVSEDNVLNLFKSSLIIEPILTALLGLIPNCAPSIIITQAYIMNVISYGAFIAGLSSNTGLGLLVLMKGVRHKKEAHKIVALLLLYSIGFGVLVDIILRHIN